MRYATIMYVTHHLIQNTGNIPAYFSAESDSFFMFIVNLTTPGQPCVLRTYADGMQTGERRYHWYKGHGLILKYVFSYLYFIHARLFVLPRRADVITFHPLFCVGSGVFRMFRGDRTFLWLFDYFDSRQGLYRIYNAMADWYVSRASIVFYLSAAMRDVYLKNLGKRAEARWIVAPLGIRIEPHLRTPKPGVLGFIGLIKEDQGLDLVMKALQMDASLRMEVIGDGAIAQLRQAAEEAGVADKVIFLGPIVDNAEVKKIASHWQIALAPYQLGNYIRYADPGKLKLYLQLGIPVITTDANPIHAEIAELKCGEIVDPAPADILRAVHAIQADYAAYEQGIRAIGARYEFERLYDDAFSVLVKPS